MHARGVNPHLIGDRGVTCRNQMREYEQLDARRLSDPARVLGTRVTGEEVLPESLRWGFERRRARVRGKYIAS